MEVIRREQHSGGGVSGSSGDQLGAPGEAEHRAEQPRGGGRQKYCRDTLEEPAGPEHPAQQDSGRRGQTPQTGAVEAAAGAEHGYAGPNLEYNNIRDEGCLWLAKTTFPELRKLLLAGNNICDRGLKHLVLGDWKHLEELGLSKHRVT